MRRGASCCAVCAPRCRRSGSREYAPPTARGDGCMVEAMMPMAAGCAAERNGSSSLGESGTRGRSQRWSCGRRSLRPGNPNGMDVIRIICAILLPPLGVFLQVGRRWPFLAEHSAHAARLHSGDRARGLDHRQALGEKGYGGRRHPHQRRHPPLARARRAPARPRGGNRPAARGAPRVLAGRPLPHTRDAAAHGPRRSARPDPGHRRHRDRADRCLHRAGGRPARRAQSGRSRA